LQCVAALMLQCVAALMLQCVAALMLQCVAALMLQCVAELHRSLPACDSNRCVAVCCSTHVAA